MLQLTAHEPVALAGGSERVPGSASPVAVGLAVTPLGTPHGHRLLRQGPGGRS